MSTNSNIAVNIYTNSGQPVTNAHVEITGSGISRQAVLNPLSGAYEVHAMPAGSCEIRVSAEGFAGQRKSIVLTPQGFSDTIILGAEGMKHFYRGTVKVPFEPDNRHFGVLVRPSALAEVMRQIEGLFQVKPLPAGLNYEKNGALLYAYPPETASEADRERLRTRIAVLPGVIIAAPILLRTEKNMSLLTGEIIARLRPQAGGEELDRLLHENRLEIVRRIGPHTLQLRSLSGNGYDILDKCENLKQSGKVEYAEPNLAGTSEDD